MKDFVDRHRRDWERLAQLTARARKSLRRLSSEELDELDVLYRKTAAQLALVTSRTRDASLTRYLNDLTAAAHSVIYTPSRPAELRFWQFLSDAFPAAVGRQWRYHTASALLFLGGSILGYAAVMRDPASAYALLPVGELRLPGTAVEQLLEALRSGRDMDGALKFQFASFLFVHNLEVGALAMVTGVLAAVPTCVLMLYNGMVIGAFTMVHHMKGIYLEYWAWILPHGITEIGAIVLCGGIGLQLGKAIVAPGLLERSEALRRAGRECLTTLAGVALMLLLAALIESYLRQSHLSSSSRLFFAGASAVFWTWYFMRVRLRPRPVRAPF